MSRYELVIENRVICSNLWEELFANSRIVCHNSSLCLYCLVERSHSSRTHARTSHPIDASSLTIMKFTSWLRNITRVDSLCPNGCPRANSRMDRYSVEPRPFLFPLASFSPYTDDIVTSCVILLISSSPPCKRMKRDLSFVFLSFFSPMLRRMTGRQSGKDQFRSVSF